MTIPDAPHALIVGEALIDVVHRADGATSEHPGGSLANVALTLGRLGRDARLATWIGPDAHGDTIRGWLAHSDVTLVPGSDGADRTSVAAARLDAEGAATYEFDLSFQVPPAAIATDHTLVVHTGSIGATLQPGGQQVLDLLTSARATSTITYDPNARPSIMGDPVEVAAWMEQFIHAADVVKVSDEDLAWLGLSDPVAAASQWATWGPALVVVTLGGSGAVAVHGREIIEIRAPKVEVVDTVGAGDSFMGALIDGLWSADLLGADRREALRSADTATLRAILERCAAVAAVTVSRAGANPPRLAELGAS